MRVGRFEVIARPGSWCRPREWVFARQACDDEDCIVLDVAWLVVTWYRGGHMADKLRRQG